ncbi:MAG TPA: hypothetical protein VHZ95_16820, partial [Polyangiales bacterium]|nr:hypothetical protein [Polyangiales bacterium]
PSVVGNGLRLFRDLDAYRDYMHVNVAYDWVWTEGDDASVLGLATEHIRRLNKKQRRDIERHRLALHPPGIAPIVIATDGDDVDRPFGAEDVRQVVLSTRAICAAFARGELEFEGDVSFLGERRRASVRLRHPDATDADLGLTIIPDIDFAEAPTMRS